MPGQKTVTMTADDHKALMDRIATVEQGQMQSLGLDPQIAARQRLGFKPVQFTRNYTRAAVPSDVQKGANIHEQYSVEAGAIVLLREDEVTRLVKEYPAGEYIEKRSGKKIDIAPLLVTDKGKFAPQLRLSFKRQGNGRYERIEDKIEVKDLLKDPPQVG